LTPGIKTWEFWAAVILSIIPNIWPEFPKEAWQAILVWVGARLGQQFFGLTGTDGKPIWLTTEFWVAILFAVIKTIFPDIPEESFYAALAWIVGRPVVKASSGFSLAGLIKKPEGGTQ
jgi:hypothetical protein